MFTEATQEAKYIQKERKRGQYGMLTEIGQTVWSSDQSSTPSEQNMTADILLQSTNPKSVIYRALGHQLIYYCTDTSQGSPGWPGAANILLEVGA